jgi:hypothetical protein
MEEISGRFWIASRLNGTETSLQIDFIPYFPIARVTKVTGAVAPIPRQRATESPLILDLIFLLDRKLMQHLDSGLILLNPRSELDTRRRGAFCNISCVN